MAISYEESKKKLLEAQAAAAPMMMRAMPVAADAGIMTLSETDDQIAAYAGWTRSTKYEWYSQYSDEKISTIDENKNIIVDPAQINISQEENSQFIPFEMPQYYDGFNLMNATISIHYLTSDGYHGASTAVNVESNGTHIRFGWLVDKNATHVAGNLKFEIRATGSNNRGKAYVWKSKIYDKMTVLQSLIDDAVIELDDSWVQEIVTAVAESVAEQIANQQIESLVRRAENAASDAEGAAEAAAGAVSAALENYYDKDEIDQIVEDIDVSDQLVDYAKSADVYTKGEVDGLLEQIDVTDQLVDYAKTADVEKKLEDYALKTDIPSLAGYATEQFVTDEIKKIDVTDQLGDYAKTEDVNKTLESYATKQFVTDELGKIDVTEQLADYAKSADVYTKTQVDTIVSGVESSVGTNTSGIASLNEAMTEVRAELATVDKNPRMSYEATYGTVELDDGSTQENTFTLWQTEGEGDPTVKSRFVITGGSGGGSGTSLSIAYVDGYKSPIIATVDDRVIIRFQFNGEDAAGDTELEAVATWTVAGRVVARYDIVTGEREFDITDYVSTGSSKVNLTIKDATGAVATKNWTVQVIDVRLTSDFNDKKHYPAGQPVTFTFTPYGGVDKTAHFLLDGEEIATKTCTGASSGLSDYYDVPAQEHGTHLFEMYLTATVNDKPITSNRIASDIMWFDESSDVPVIAAALQEFEAKQYATTAITFTVFDPKTETPTVTLAASYVNEDGETVVESTETRTMTDGNKDEWQYKTSVMGEHTLVISCGEGERKVEKTLKATITDIGITVTPVTAGLVFDFNPVGRSNASADRLWSDGDIAMTVSENFDWVNGGWQTDENGDQYFGIKAGTSAEINYQLFGDDAKTNGKEMKLVFMTKNVADTEAVFFDCLSEAVEGEKIGFQMKAHEATVYGMAGSLDLPYSEDDIIEFEFNISPIDSAVPMVMGYEDGVSTRPMVFDSTYNFQQRDGYRKNILLGSPDCNMRIYRLKVYNKGLSDRDILNNFIADARSAEEMVARYTRNQIYDENGALTPETLAEKCPWLRVYKLSAPYFTNNRSDKVSNTTIQQIYKDGDPTLDNWTCYNCRHSGQGTSSNKYGAAGRNLDFIMNDSGIDGVEPYFILGDGSRATEITATRTSVPVAYQNFKANIASSNNMTNAMLANRFNQFQPYRRPFVRTASLSDVYSEDEIANMTEQEQAEALAKLQEKVDAEIKFIKDTMEFYNAVVFIQETNEDVSTHREFADTNWHFYAIGNIGDSKKSDKSRLTDMDDPYEHCIEVMDVELPLSDFPANTMMNAMGYKIDEDTKEVIYDWAKDENLGILYELIDGEYVLTQDTTVDLTKTYYVDILEHDDFSEDYTYGWRYISDDEDDEIVDYCHQRWIEFYRFVTTSSDEKFKANLGDYAVVDTLLYYYLFTTRYCMVDNRAKNLFFHYGKTGEVDSDGNPIRKYDLTWDYDNDTACGLNNYGKQVYRYGLEDIDHDENGEWVFREADSTLFCRLRDLFPNELKAMYNTLESNNAWHAESFINKADEWQSQFPEELWRLDVQRKYIRSYTSSFINGAGDNQFLVNMANGKMKYHRRQWERNQEKYMASKYQTSTASEESIDLRCKTPEGTLVVPTNYRFKITPYAYMYLNVQYGTTSPIQLRAEPNVEYEIPFEGDAVDIVSIYNASFIKSIGDLSPSYPATVGISKASKLRELIIGNETEGYDNPSFTTLTLGANPMLEKINVENVSGLTQTLNMTRLGNLKEVYAFGTNTSGVMFADGGNVHTAEIPDINSLEMKNLSYLDDEGFKAAGYSKLSRLVAENSQLDLINIINNAPNLYQVRLIGIDWRLDNTGLLERLYNLAGVNNTGGNAERSVLSGSVYVRTIKQRQLELYNAAWPDLTITYDHVTPQYKVTFQNYNGVVLEEQYVDSMALPVDPVTRAENPIPTPVRESTVSTNYTYAGWDLAFTPVVGERTYTATYTESVRQYTITYQSNNIVLQSTVAAYGEVVPYEGELPVIPDANPVFYLFEGWDQNGYVDGDKTINAVFDSCQYKEDYFKDLTLEDMRPVEVNMLLKLSKTYIEGSPDPVVNISEVAAPGATLSIPMGADFTFDEGNEEKERVLISEPMTFDGTNQYDTGVNLMDVDRDFVIAIDFEMSSENKANAVIAQCMSDYDSTGFKLLYNNGVRLNWADSDCAAATANTREMIVLRHKAGEYGVYVYVSDVKDELKDADDEAGLLYKELSGVHAATHDVSLVFGCAKDEGGSLYNKSIGTVYWSKVWFTDLGDTACRQLAYWPHEEVEFKTSYGVSDDAPITYYLSDGTRNKNTMTFISSGVLPYARPMGSTIRNIGGWAESTLRTYLNERLLKAFDGKWRQLFKQVIVKSTIGDRSSETSESNCYIFAPSITELRGYIDSKAYGVAPYTKEANTNEQQINLFKSSSDLACYLPDGTAVQYWTRSPNVNIGSVGEQTYFLAIKSSGSNPGSVAGTIVPNNTGTYVRIMLCM